MKICFIGTRIGQIKGTFPGGSRKSLINLSRALAKRGHEIFLVATPPTPYSYTIEGVEWCSVNQVNAYGNTASLRYGTKLLLDGIRKIKKIHAKEELDIIHSHSGDPKLCLLSGIAGKICKIPSIHTVYTTLDSPQKMVRSQHGLFSTYTFFSFANPYFLSQADYLFAISNNVRASIERMLPKKRIEVIPPGVDFCEFNPDVLGNIFRDKLEIKEDENVLLFLGDRKAKGLEILIDAMKKLENFNSKIKLVIGAGSNVDYVKDFIRDIKHSCILLGIIENVPSAMAASDIYVAPFLSTFDVSDYPMSILEAMAMGKPVIASSIGGIPEIIEDGKTGILTEPNSSDKLSEEIILLIKDRRKREKLGKDAYYNIKEKFSIERLAKRYEKVYEEL